MPAAEREGDPRESPVTPVSPLAAGRKTSRGSIFGGFQSFVEGTALESEWRVEGGDDVTSDARDKLLAAEIKSLELKSKAHTPDCGYIGQPPHLSRHFSKLLRRYHQLGFLDEEGYQRLFPLTANFGWHDFPLIPFISNLAKEPEILSPYGVGISFYFKMLKALIVILLLMNVCTVPSMIMYSELSQIEPADKAFRSHYKGLDSMTYTTLGSLGSPIPSCRQVNENSIFSFQCPLNGVIQSVIAYYGQPSGSCTCPGNLQLSSSGSCAGDIITTGLIDSTTIASTHCEVDKVTGNPLPCYLGSTRFGNPCCSTTVDVVSGEGDLSSLQLRPNLLCNSLTAPTIGSALCTGKSSCTFNVSSSFEYRFPVSNIAYGNSSTMCSSIESTGSELICVSDLVQGGNFDACSVVSDRYMIFEAICVSASKTSAEGQNISNRSVVRASTYLDAVSIIIFIAGVLWMKHEQEREDSIIDSTICRANQFTLSCDTIPPHEDFAGLRRAFVEYFEGKLGAVTDGVKYRIADVNFASSCYSYLQAACRRGEIAKKIDRDIMKFCARIYCNDFNGSSFEDIILLNRLKRNLYLVAQINDDCLRLQHTASASINRAYITFETEEAYLDCLRRYGRHASGAGVIEPIVDGKSLRVKMVGDTVEH